MIQSRTCNMASLVLTLVLLFTKEVWCSYYTAAVVEYHYTYNQELSAKNNVLSNVKTFVKIISNLEKEIDIVVFPENGLTGHTNNNPMEAYVSVPAPSSQLPITTGNQVLKLLSDAAKNSNTYVVVNLLEKDGSNQYNTNVVFRKNGTIAARKKYILATLFGIQRIRTTAYHPCSNGMVERVHRQLKAALKCHASEQWTDALPAVLLGMRATYRDELGASSAELVYGSALRLPGDFFVPPTLETTPHEFMNKLRQIIEKIHPRPGSNHDRSKVWVHKDLQKATHVFLRDDTIKKPLQAAYSGPYRVLDRNENCVKLLQNRKEAWVSIQRVKPAYSLQDIEEFTSLDKPQPSQGPTTKKRVTITVPQAPCRTKRGEGEYCGEVLPAR